MTSADSIVVAESAAKNCYRKSRRTLHHWSRLIEPDGTFDGALVINGLGEEIVVSLKPLSSDDNPSKSCCNCCSCCCC